MCCIKYGPEIGGTKQVSTVLIKLNDVKRSKQESSLEEPVWHALLQFQSKLWTGFIIFPTWLAMRKETFHEVGFSDQGGCKMPPAMLKVSV